MWIKLIKLTGQVVQPLFQIDMSFFPVFRRVYFHFLRSNGVGASGVFIALYVLMDVIKTRKDFSVFDAIAGMRKDRVNMVLTKVSVHVTNN